MSHLTLLILLALSPAHAQSADAPLAVPSEDAPLAIPATPPPTAGPTRVEPPQPSAAELRALTQYREDRITIRSETEFHGGGTMIVGGWGGAYRAGPGVHVAWGVPGVVLSEPVTASPTWAAYQGPRRLDAPDFLRAAGELERAEALDKDIRHAKRASYAWMGVAGAGAVAAVTGLMGIGITDDRDINILYNNLMVGGATVAAVGLVGSSFPSARARSLQTDLPASISLAEAQEMAAKRNEALRQELSLSPAQVWGVESQAR